MQYFNLTGHPVEVLDPDTGEITLIPRDERGNIRIQYGYTKRADGLYEIGFDVPFLPPEEEGVLVILSAIAAKAAWTHHPKRNDIVHPATHHPRSRRVWRDDGTGKQAREVDQVPGFCGRPSPGLYA